MEKIVLLVTFIFGITIPSLAYDFEVDDIYYDSLSSKTCEVVRGLGYSSEEVIIPKFVAFNGKYYEIVKISSDAFYGAEEVRTVHIGASVTTIFPESFIHCKELTTIDVDGGNLVYSSYQGALYNKQRSCLIKLPMGKTEYDIPDGVREIGDDALGECLLLRRLSIPNSVTRIGVNAFYCCNSLRTILIPNSVKEIDDYAFAGCKALESLSIPSSVIKLGRSSLSFCLSLKSVDIHASTEIVPDGFLQGCITLKSVSIPSTITVIGHYAFSQCDSLQNIEIPNTVKFIGNRAFFNCNSLQLKKLPENTTTIGKQAFEYCKQLDTIALAKNVSEIGYMVFNGCNNLTHVKVDKENPTYTSFMGALYDYEKKMLIKVPPVIVYDSIPSSIQKICPYALFKCASLTKVRIPKGVSCIGEWAFVGCSSLDSVYMVTPVNLADTYLPEGTRTLYVPRGKKSDFLSSKYYMEQYSRFKAIEEYDSTPTSIIRPASIEYGEATTLYNLQGVRVSNRNPFSKGIYVVRGKKKVVR